jgi:hypothetical protein
LQPPFYFDIQEVGVIEYVKAGKAEGRALFFSWPSRVMHCLEHYTGDTVFWIGEGSTDDIMPCPDEWLEVHRIETPSWFGVHDDFVVYKRKSHAGILETRMLKKSQD